MTYDDYWFGDPWMVIYYEEAHKLRNQMQNQQMWMQGAYIYNAFAVVLSNAFAKRGATPQKYMEEPFDIYPERTAQVKREKARDEVVRQLNQLKRMWDKRKAKESE